MRVINVNPFSSINNQSRVNFANCKKKKVVDFDSKNTRENKFNGCKAQNLCKETKKTLGMACRIIAVQQEIIKNLAGKINKKSN